MGVSRGAAGRAGLVTQGYTGVVPKSIVDALTLRPIVVGQSGAKRRIDQLDEVIIWAKLIEVNSKAAPPPDIKGGIRVKVDKPRGIAVLAEHISSRTRDAWEFIKVSVGRLK